MAQAHIVIKKHFRQLKDPRRRHRRKYLLGDIIVIAICAVIAGCNDWQQIATYGRERHDWFKRFLDLPDGSPAHDTFERIFDRLDPSAFQACFRTWMESLSAVLGLKQIAIDGKTLCGSGTSKLGALHLVSAWATANHLSLGQVAVAEKSNEITAIPQLLDLLDVHGAFVSIDAMGCQKEIAAKIRERGGDYVLSVKDNQPTLLEDIQNAFTRALDTNFAGLDHDEYETHEKGHGREERRRYVVIHEPATLRQKELWQDLRVIGMCVSERTTGGETTIEARYFIGSRKASAKKYGQALRNHWRIENTLHWQLDVCFAEDRNRVSRRHGAENLALVRRLALSLLKQHPDKRSIACKRIAAAVNSRFLEEVLCGSGDLGNR
jgi:predicted transposase YbfD/YdcC